MKKLLLVLAVLLAMPFAMADTWVGVDLDTTENLYADISLNGDLGSTVFVNGDQLANQGDIPSIGEAQNSILRKIVDGINAVDEFNHEGTPLIFTKTGLNDFSRAVAWALYEHYVPRREFYPVAKTVEYNSLRITAIERLLEQKYPDEYCDIKKDLMEEYDLPYISCVNGVGEYIKYENPTPSVIIDEHGCLEDEEFCERTQKCFIPGEEYCDGMIVVRHEEEPLGGGGRGNRSIIEQMIECVVDEDCEEGLICEEGFCEYMKTEDEGLNEWDTNVVLTNYTEFEIQKGVGEPCEENGDCVSGICYVNTKVCGANKY